MSLAMVSNSGCSYFEANETIKKKPSPWQKLYTEVPDDNQTSLSKNYSVRTYSFSSCGSPFSDFIRWFSDKTGSGVVSSSQIDTVSVTCEFKNATPDEIMSALSRRYNVDIVKLKNTYYLGKLNPEDRGCYVRRVRGYDASDLQTAISAFLSEHGKVTVQKDGVVIVSDTEAVLQRVSAMLESVEAASGDAWICQFYLVALRDGLKASGGADVLTSGQVAYKLNKGEKFEPTWDNIGQELNFNFDSSADIVHLFASPMFILRDGTTGEWSDGQRVPVPKKSVSDYGTVTTTGFEYVDTGIQLKSKIRECRAGAILTVDYSDSTITGYVEYSPILRKSSLKTESPVGSGRIYLIGELQRYEESKGITSVLDLTDGKSRSTLQLFCRLYKISAPTLNVTEAAGSSEGPLPGGAEGSAAEVLP